MGQAPANTRENGEGHTKITLVRFAQALPGAVALHPLALELARAADGGCALTGALLAGLLVVTAELHLAIDALTLQLLLERPQRLVDIIVANDDLHKAVQLRSRYNRIGFAGA